MLDKLMVEVEKENLSALVEEDTDLKHFVQQNGRWVMNSIIPSLLLTYGIIVLYYITFNI